MSPQLDILCKSAVKRYWSKNNNSPFTCHLLYRIPEFRKAKKTCNQVVGPQSDNCFTLDSFVTKMYQDFRDVDHLKRVLRSVTVMDCWVR